MAKRISPDEGITRFEQGDALFVDIRDPASFDGLSPLVHPDIVVRRSAAKALTSMGKTPQGTASPWVPIE